jgi:hypothetical protein
VNQWHLADQGIKQIMAARVGEISVHVAELSLSYLPPASKTRQLRSPACLQVIPVNRTMSSTTLILTGKNVLLPGNATPQPATIKIDKRSGKIIDVQVGYKVLGTTPDVKLIDAGDKFILPGLVEWV